MQRGDFDYSQPKATLIGYVDDRGTYYLTDGHHRVNAALEIWWETGNRDCLDRLIAAGAWHRRKPESSYRLPTRTMWSRLLSLFEYW